MRRSLPYLRQLDSVRAFAVLAVLVSHWLPGSNRFGSIGLAGVYMFFVLSGFLITGILIQNRLAKDRGEIDLRAALGGFFGRRLLRIFPAYYLTLLVSYLLLPRMTRADLAWNLSYLGNMRAMLHGQMFTLNHFWSLAVEEQFYLVWPFLILLLPMRHWRVTLLSAILLSPAWRVFAMAMGWRHVVYSYPVWSNLDALGLGALLAVSRHDAVLEAIRRRWLGWAGAIGAIAWLGCGLATWLFLGGFRLSRPGMPYAAVFIGYPLAVSLAAVYLIAHAAQDTTQGIVARILSLPALRWIGKISYGIYLYHLLVSPALDTLCVRWLGQPLPEMLRFVLLTIVTVTVAAASYVILERPLLALARDSTAQQR